MKLYLVFGVDADADYFLIGICENRAKSEQMILEHNADAECLEWQDEKAPLWFLLNTTPLASIHCHHASYYIAELTVDEALG